VPRRTPQICPTERMVAASTSVLAQDWADYTLALRPAGMAL
jgi:hypothetical protein